jgi:hypothetical protein
MDLVLVGTFEAVSGAEAAIERMKALKALAEAEWSDDDWSRRDGRMPMTLVEELSKLKLIDMGRSDVDIYAFDHSVERRGSTVRIHTEESEVQGFLKVLIHLGARVEVFSRHEWNEDGTPKTTEDATPQADDATSQSTEGGTLQAEGESPPAEGETSQQDETPQTEAVS